LLRTGPQASTDGIIAAAEAARLPLTVLDLHDEGLRDLYEADAALIRPDQVVAWRGSGASANAEQLIAKVTGHAASPQ
jgi:hypothetical protein